MTKEQFLSGQSFKVKGSTYKGAETYFYSAKNNYVGKQIRSSIDEKVVLEDHCCNVDKVGRVGFTGYTYVMKNKVNIKYRFEDLVIYQEGV